MPSDDSVMAGSAIPVPSAVANTILLKRSILFVFQ